MVSTTSIASAKRRPKRLKLQKLSRWRTLCLLLWTRIRMDLSPWKSFWRRAWTRCQILALWELRDIITISRVVSQDHSFLSLRTLTFHVKNSFCITRRCTTILPKLRPTSRIITQRICSYTQLLQVRITLIPVCSEHFAHHEEIEKVEEERELKYEGLAADGIHEAAPEHKDPEGIAAICLPLTSFSPCCVDSRARVEARS